MNFGIGKNVIIVQTREEPRPDSLAPKIKRPSYSTALTAVHVNVPLLLLLYRRDDLLNISTQTI